MQFYHRNDTIDDPQTYAIKCGIIYQIVNFNHNIRDIILNKYKMMYLKSLISRVKKNAYKKGLIDSQYRESNNINPFGINPFGTNYIIGGNKDLNPFSHHHYIRHPHNNSPLCMHGLKYCISCNNRKHEY